MFSMCLPFSSHPNDSCRLQKLPSISWKVYRKQPRHNSCSTTVLIFPATDTFWGVQGHCYSISRLLDSHFAIGPDTGNTYPYRTIESWMKKKRAYFLVTFQRILQDRILPFSIEGALLGHAV